MLVFLIYEVYNDVRELVNIFHNEDRADDYILECSAEFPHLTYEKEEWVINE